MGPVYTKMPTRTSIYSKNHSNMYITVMDFSTETITKLVWDVPTANNEETEILLERMGYHLSQISYMTTEEEPAIGLVEVSDVLSEE